MMRAEISMAEATTTRTKKKSRDGQITFVHCFQKFVSVLCSPFVSFLDMSVCIILGYCRSNRPVQGIVQKL